jgi:hypothetical protein
MPATLLFVLKQIADLCEQYFLVGRSGDGFFFFDEGVDAFDQEENAKGDDEEIQGGGNKITPGEDGTDFLGVGQGKVTTGILRDKIRLCLHDFVRERNVKVGKIEVANQLAQGRHDDVAHERGDDFAKRRADDDADGEVNDVSPHDECFELLNDFHNGILSMG